MAGLHDAVANHIFTAGLTLAAALEVEGGVDAAVAGRVHDALDTLDAAIAALRTADFERVVAHREPSDRQQLSTPDGHRRLSHIIAGDGFAYSVANHDFHRSADDRLWAHESDGLLLSARFGTPLARRVGNVFYDLETNAPLYHEDGHAALEDGK